MDAEADAAAAPKLPSGHEVHAAPGYLIRPRPPAEVRCIIIPPAGVQGGLRILLRRPDLHPAVSTRALILAANAAASAIR